MLPMEGRLSSERNSSQTKPEACRKQMKRMLEFDLALKVSKPSRDLTRLRQG